MRAKKTETLPQNRTKTGVRDGGGRFNRGASGNPGGRPKALAELRDRIRARGDDLVQALLDIALGPARPARGSRVAAPSPRDRVLAAKLLLEYGFGRATLAVEISGPGGGPLETRPLHELTSTERRQRFQELMAKAGVKAVPVEPSAEGDPASTPESMGDLAVRVAAGVAAAEADDEDEEAQTDA